MEEKGGGILITGGTGFLGRALARALLADETRTDRVCIYSRDEHTQAKMFEDLGDHPRLRMFIGDVRDRERLYWAMRSVDVVIHAAALKRIEVGHYNPGEMVKTNIVGTVNVVDAALASGIRRAVLVSTDKAYQPVSPYGLSKGMAESIFLAANNTVGPRGPSFAVCRYGNVAGSTGSVIPRWRAMIEAVKDRDDHVLYAVPVTDPEATRFWMTVDQAVDLVLSAVRGKVMERTGDILIPKLPAFDLGTLARAMGARGIAVTGMQPWEKKDESLNAEQCSATARRMTVEELREALKHV